MLTALSLCVRKLYFVSDAAKLKTANATRNTCNKDGGRLSMKPTEKVCDRMQRVSKQRSKQNACAVPSATAPQNTQNTSNDQTATAHRTIVPLDRSDI